MTDIIAGIDLGTTNSEIALFLDGAVRVLPPDGDPVLPSVVGLALDGTLLVGDAARNQLPLFPERTVRSIKRLMGTSETVSVGDKAFTPPEISAMILRTLKERAESCAGAPVEKAIITVPAFFSDAQRQATREAGAIAGFEVLRILNEPTAAALAYGEDREGRKTVLVYDLGGGTFDVSIVHVAGEIIEVLASHGNTHLGGDDFDDLLVAHVEKELRMSGAPDLTGDQRVMGRVRRACEEAKKRLSFEPYTRIREEHLCEVNGKPFHADIEVSRTTLEGLIRSLLERTMESVGKAMSDAKKTVKDIDDVLLVGGATRTPLVSDLLEDRFGKRPRQDLHPDLCVALGAGVLASRLSGHAVDRILVDVSPYSFGPSYLGNLDGFQYPHCYQPVLARNTPLPASRAQAYATVSDYQKAVEIRVFQGEDPDAMNNILIGKFKLADLAPVPAPNQIICRFDLDIDGILHVTATEKLTGKSVSITIERATSNMTPEDLEAARARMEELFGSEGEVPDEFRESDLGDGAGFVEGTVVGGESPLESQEAGAARKLIERSRGLFQRMTLEDRDDVIRLHEEIEDCIQAGDPKRLEKAMGELEEILFFVEER